VVQSILDNQLAHTFKIVKAGLGFKFLSKTGKSAKQSDSLGGEIKTQ